MSETLTFEYYYEPYDDDEDGFNQIQILNKNPILRSEAVEQFLLFLKTAGFVFDECQIIDDVSIAFDVQGRNPGENF